MRQGTEVTSVKSETTEYGGLQVDIEVERTGPNMFRLEPTATPDANDLPPDVAEALFLWVMKRADAKDFADRLGSALAEQGVLS